MGIILSSVAPANLDLSTPEVRQCDVLEYFTPRARGRDELAMLVVGGETAYDGESARE